MSEIFVKCVSDHQGALIGLTVDNIIVMADDFKPRLAALHIAGYNEAVAEALVLQRLYWLYEGWIKDNPSCKLHDAPPNVQAFLRASARAEAALQAESPVA